MLLRPIREEDRAAYDQVVQHPLQSWAWGEFRRKTGVEIERIGFFDGGTIKTALQVFFHPIPGMGMTAGYIPKGPMPDEDQLSAIDQLAKTHGALFVKMEPNIGQPVGQPSAHGQIAKFLLDHNCTPGRPLFTKYTFQLSLKPTEQELFAGLSSKTRYNVNVAFRKGVQIYENTSAEGMEQYIAILQETTKRQGFYAHTPQYFRTMWEVLGGTGMMRIFHAIYENTILVSWVMFIFNGKLYYPYGASRSIHRDVMASNLMMWEMIKFGKEMGCETFDMWGSLGPEPDEKDPWYGFHRFKKGFGGELVEFLGTYDFITNPQMYPLYKIAENIRWKFLKFKARL